MTEQTTQRTITGAPPSAATDANYARRWWIMAIIGIAQLMVVLDATVVNIAMPSAQQALGFSDGDRQWIITAYALSFGSLLLFGGRLSDLFGRKRTLIVGLIGFAVASAAGGAAQSFSVLVAARAFQGAFGALLAPAALSLLSTTFTVPDERVKAFGLYGAIAGAGGAFGLLLGGVITESLSWRWTMYVNLAFAIPAALGALALVKDEARSARRRLDIPGTLTASGGLFALVFGFSQAERTGWDAASTLAFFAAGVVLLATFVTDLLPGELIAGAGLGLVLAPAMNIATLGVRAEDAGVASALVNTMQQIGGSIGTALLSTLAASGASGFAVANHASANALAEAAVHGYTTAFWWSAGIFAAGALVSGLLLRGPAPQLEPGAEPAAVPAAI